MNPKSLEPLELITIEEQTTQVMQQAQPRSYLYQTARRLQSIMQLELIRRGLFERQIAALRKNATR
ncbi:hypothetical protein HZU75_13360 [Chitinibacter fontanus]|uniref:Uncharacterized protein n=1 Tax=Chitinibacter fontanus TaxID=1737446 RepID=A0A7D5VBU7_9NEIS|nr:hypothetical protein [Chitinibacter fontanus]QLI82433.1 hypothetical protein HZU75_13360 [Chitinibacter fontanus]